MRKIIKKSKGRQAQSEWTDEAQRVGESEGGKIKVVKQRREEVKRQGEGE